MEDSVALDSSKQKEFVKGIKKLLKKKDKNNVGNDKKEKTKGGKVFKKKKHEKGLVYLSHIPHGFYEREMTEYFKQFGVVTNVRVIRSRRTGNSKGYAFVEFRNPAVAEIVAETMNNYLMGKRLLKAEIVPPEKQRKFALRKNWNNQNNPAQNARLKMKNIINAKKTDEEDLKTARNLLATLSKTKKKLSELSIDYDFFTPVDIPEQLQPKKEKTDKPNKTDKSDHSEQKEENVIKKAKTKIEEKNYVKIESKKKFLKKNKTDKVIEKVKTKVEDKKDMEKETKKEVLKKKKADDVIERVQTKIEDKKDMKKEAMKGILKKKKADDVIEKVKTKIESKKDMKKEAIKEILKKKKVDNLTEKIKTKVEDEKDAKKEAKKFLKKTKKPQDLRIKRKNK